MAGDRDVVIRVAAVGVCGSDVHYFRHGRIGALVAAQPIVLGHEAAGEVVAVGRKAGKGTLLDPPQAGFQQLA